jgi:hypothetical protein
MNLICAAILMLGASVSVQREIETNDTIAGIVAQVLWGAVEDAFVRDAESKDCSGIRAAGSDLLSSLRLRIDGQPRTGFWSWAGAAYRVAGYALDRQSGGCVTYSYRLRVRGYDVRRHTEISDGRVTLTTSTGWTEMVPVLRSTKRILIYVSFVIAATERSGKTSLLGSATGWADCSEFDCRLVRSVAERTAATELRYGLGRFWLAAETTGRDWYAGGSELAPILDGLRAGFEMGRRLRP